MPRPLRIAVVADIHHGRDTFSKRGTAALPLLKRFVEEANEARVDAVLDLGDRVSDEDPERDRVLQGEVAGVFAKLRAPWHRVDGNHDRATLSAAELDAILGRPGGSRAVDLDGVRVVLWQPDVTLTRGRGLRLAPGDLESLSSLLRAAPGPTFLVSHAPLSGQSQAGNFWFENNPDHAAYRADFSAIRSVIGDAAVPVVALAGHVHWNSFTVLDGTPHITLQSLTETWTTGGEPSACAGLLTTGDRQLRWRVTGMDPFEIVLPWPPATRPRPAPLPPFRELSADVAPERGGRTAADAA